MPRTILGVALLALALAACSQELTPVTDSEPARPKVAELAAFDFLPFEIGVDGYEVYQIAYPSFRARSIEFDYRPAKKSPAGGLKALCKLGGPIGLPYHPVSGYWSSPEELVLLGFDADSFRAVVERWRLATTVQELEEPGRGSRWILPGLVKAERVLEFEPGDGLYVNAICPHPNDPNVLFACTHDAGRVLRIDLVSGGVSTLVSPGGEAGFDAPALADTGWNSVNAESTAGGGVKLTLMKGDFYCSIYAVAELHDDDGDGRFDRVSRAL